MDPVTALSIASNAVQFAETAFKVIKAVSLYCEDVKNAPRQAEELHQEISIMIGVVAILKIALETRCERFSATQKSSLRNAINGSVDILNKILQKMENKSNDNRERSKQNLKWPFQKREIENALREIDGHKVMLCLALQIENVYCPFASFEANQCSRSFSRVEDIVSASRSAQNGNVYPDNEPNGKKLKRKIIWRGCVQRRLILWETNSVDNFNGRKTLQLGYSLIQNLKNGKTNQGHSCGFKVKVIHLVVEC
jgi:hypothetical protein